MGNFNEVALGLGTLSFNGVDVGYLKENVNYFDKTNENPPYWEQVQGIHGIPVLEFPEVIIVMTVTGQ